MQAVVPDDKKPDVAEGGDAQPATNWSGIFSISSYSPYFNVDTDVVVDRIVSSLYPLRGDFFRKIDANPDLFKWGLLLVVPVEIFRWIIIILAGSASACFLSTNLGSHTDGNDLMVLVVSAFLLQFFVAVLIKVLFFA
ncbi:hypothetical protein Taro_027984 [Colocasia esculenta]|uniref:Uncharacterized protein n=1 Tax=Colocasia esculenta TaxID=4460 RepID=A0A843VFB3_COLES|nr:hypothetical protein [Colocasia esculenta]